MYKKFQASVISKVDEDNGGISVSLVVDLECDGEKDNDAMCGVLKTPFPLMATISWAAALGTEIACG
jgi:hypothetical protein